MANGKTVSVKQEFVTRDMRIGDIVNKYPEAISTLMENGIHCVGCGASGFETLEQGVLGHGYSEKQLNKLLKDVNIVISKNLNNNKEEVIEIEEIKLTKEAINKILELMKKENKAGYGLRFGIEKGGCAGEEYIMNFEEKSNSNDIVIEKLGLKVFVNKDHFKKLKGTKIHYLDSLQGGGFKISNPNASATCGCGSSFS
ncbi:MAG: iron-sulfur cluster assembly accessory protein [Nanoarchaeota archaeon]